jgi:hypothetical protein
MVSEDGEPVDPFEVEVRTSAGDWFRRSVIGIPVNDMTPLQRRGTGRYPVAVSLSQDAMLANLAVLSRLDPAFAFGTPNAYTDDRIERLKQEVLRLDAANDDFDVKRAELEFRLQSIDEGLRGRGELDARPIRWTRYFFDARYRHLVSGPVSAAGQSLGHVFQVLDDDGTASWLIEYNFGFFDTDAMSMVVRGKLCVPVQVIHAT